MLNLLDKTSASFRSVQTDFDWDQYQKVVDEHDIQKGVMYFRRSGAEVDVAADIQEPAPGSKYCSTNGELQVYRTQDRPDNALRRAQEPRRALRASWRWASADVVSDLTKNFDVSYAGIGDGGWHGRPTSWS